MKLRFRLWHLFAVVTVIAVALWAWPHVGLEIITRQRMGSRVAVFWDEHSFVLFDSLDARKREQRKRQIEITDRVQRLYDEIEERMSDLP